MTTESTPADSLSHSQDSTRVQPSLLHNIFLGPQGLRVGWRVLVYVALFRAFIAGLQFGAAHTAPIRACPFQESLLFDFIDELLRPGMLTLPTSGSST